MNAAFFTTAERLDALRAAAAAWEGTPFHAKAQLKGIGADCVSLARGIYAEAGFDGLRPFPEYSLAEGNSINESKVQAWLEAEPLFGKIWSGEHAVLEAGAAGCRDCGTRTAAIALPVEPGDLLCLRVARVSHHVGVMIGDRSFIQTFHPYYARLYTLSDPTWRRRVTAIYRPLNAELGT